MKRFSLFSLAGGFGCSPAYGGVAILLLSGLIFLPPAFSQTNETLTISTYYPSPYGVYNELRLYPKSAPLASPCSALYEGTMYYDQDTHELMVCNGIGGWGWKSVGFWTLNATDLYPTNTTWNVGIGTTTPKTPAPNALSGNLDVNDVYLRSTDKWASQSVSGGGLGSWSGPYSVDTTYTAATDGFVTVTSTAGGDKDCRVTVETPVGTLRQSASPNHDGVQVSMTSPVRKGDTWIVSYPNTGCAPIVIYWIPLGS